MLEFVFEWRCITTMTNSRRLTVLLALLVVLLDSSPLFRRHGVSAEITPVCTTSTMKKTVTCMISNWRAGNLGASQDQGISQSVMVPENDYSVEVVLECPGTFAASIAVVTKADYDACNATVDPSGKMYSYTANNEEQVARPVCIIGTNNHVQCSLLTYNGQLSDVSYFIGTVDSATATASNQLQKVQNAVNGDCSMGLKLQLTLNWQTKPTTQQPTTIPTTAGEGVERTQNAEPNPEENRSGTVVSQSTLSALLMSALACVVFTCAD